MSKEQKIIGSIVLLLILILFFTLLTSGSTKHSQVQTKANDSVKQSSQVKQSSSSSSTSSSSSETSSKVEKWSPTGHIAVDAYLNTPQIKIILRAKALREVAYKLEH